MKFRQILKVWLPVVLWMGLMFLGSSDLMSAEHTSRFLSPFLRWLLPDISPAGLAQAHFLVRKAAHLTEYAVLAALVFRALRAAIPDFWPRALSALVVAALFAAVDEFHQAFVASRTGSLGDVALDTAGAFLGIALCRAAQLLWVKPQPA